MFTIAQRVTVIDGGWTGTIERIDIEQQAAYIRFPGHPELRPYAFEALRLAVCRTCGYTDCPGAVTGNCPRWPAREEQPAAFANLSMDGLYALHAALFDETTAIHRRLIGKDGEALVPVFGDEWARLGAEHDDLYGRMLEVSAELDRRREQAHADA